MYFITDALAVSGAFLLLFTPGLLVVLTLPNDALAARMLLPAAFVLSPGVIAFELAAAAYAGVTFSSFAPAAAAINSAGAAALFILVRPHIEFRTPISWLAISALLLLPFAMIVFDAPLRREYGWHNMMQLAAIQSVYDLPKSPEDSALAGTRLGYGWLGWAQSAAIAKLLDRAPTLFFFPLNTAHFAAFFTILCETAAATSRRVPSASPLTIGMAVGASLVLPGVGGLVFLLSDLGLRLFAVELRIVPLFSKHLNMDLMVFGLSSAALMTYAAIRAAHSRRMGAALLMPVATLATALVYPLLFPSCLILGATFLLIALLSPFFPQWRVATYSRTEIGLLALAGAMCLLPLAAYLAFMGRDATGTAIHFRDARLVLGKTAMLFWTFLLINVLLLAAVGVSWRDRRGLAILLLLASGISQTAFLALRLPFANEYKFLFGALMFATPVIAAVAPTGTLGRIGVAAALAIQLIALAVITTPKHQPPVSPTEELDERHAQIQLKEAAPSWLSAVRQLTPPDTVLLSGPTERPLAIFSGRALYVCADTQSKTDGYKRFYRAGYAVTCFQELHVIRRYSAGEIERRTHLLEQVLAKRIEPALASEILGTLRLSGRPIALHTTHESGFLRWLKDQDIGRAIFADARDDVWLFE